MNLEENEISNIELYFKAFLPDLYSFINEPSSYWSKVEKKLYQYLQKEIEKKGTIGTIIDANIYNVIIEAHKNNDKAAEGMLHFFNSLFIDLQSYCDNKTKEHIKGIAKKFLISYDKDYLNFIGEIATVNAFLKKGVYELLEVEYKLPNGKSLDFALRRVGTNTGGLIEVDNIHIVDEKVEKDPEKIRTFFEHRFKSKIDYKNSNHDEKIQFLLITILWGKNDSLKTYADFFRNEKLNIQNYITPFCVVIHSDLDGNFYHNFGTLTNLFKPSDTSA